MPYPIRYPQDNNEISSKKLKTKNTISLYRKKCDPINPSMTRSQTEALDLNYNSQNNRQLSLLATNGERY